MKKTSLFIPVMAVMITACSHKITNTRSSIKAPANEGTGLIIIQNGQKYAVENKVTTHSTSEMQGQSMETNADITSIYNIEVNGLKNDNYTMTNTIAAVKFNMTTMGQVMNFDSDKKEDMNGEMGSAFKDLINQPAAVAMDKEGNIIINEADTAAPESRSQAAMLLNQLGDPREMGYGAKMAFMAIPKNAKTGTTWQDSTSADGISKITNYTITEIKADTVFINIAGTEKRDVKMEMQGMEINTTTNGNFTGEQTVNIHTGVIYKSNLDANSAGNISVMGQDIPTKIKVTSITTVTPM